MKLYVKHKKVEYFESDWCEYVEGQLHTLEDFQLGFDEYFKRDEALRYEIFENIGSLYLRCIHQEKEEEMDIHYEYEIYILFEEDDKEEVVHLVQKYLMNATAFWKAMKSCFVFDPESQTFRFHYLNLVDSEIRLPQIGIDKEYSLPLVLKNTNQKALELLASGLELMDSVCIITKDSIEGISDLKYSIFITEHLEKVKSEIKGVKAKRTLVFTTKLIALTVSTVGIAVVAFRFIKKLSKKNG